MHGNEELPEKTNVITKELSLEKTYIFRQHNHLYIFLLRKNIVNKNVLVLILAIPLSKDESENQGFFIKEGELTTKLNTFFHNDYPTLSERFWLGGLNVNKNENLRFCVNTGFRVIIELFNNKLYSHSEQELLEIGDSESMLNRIKYGVREHNTTFVFDNNFLFVDLRIVFISYTSDHAQNKEQKNIVVRKFIDKSVVAWTKTITENRNTFLNESPTFAFNRIKYIKRIEKTDKFEVQIGPHEITFSVSFDEKTEANPKIQIRGREPLGEAVELTKLSLAGINVVELTLENSFVFYFATPKFFWEKDLGAKDIFFFVHYNVRKNSENSNKSLHKYISVFYPLVKSKTSFTIESELEHEKTTLITFKRIFKEGCLSFQVEILMTASKIEKFELPPVSDKTHPELKVVYATLQKPLNQVFNGTLFKSKIKETKTCCGLV